MNKKRLEKTEAGELERFDSIIRWKNNIITVDPAPASQRSSWRQYQRAFKQFQAWIKLNPDQMIELRAKQLSSADLIERGWMEDKVLEFKREISKRSEHSSVLYVSTVKSFFMANRMPLYIRVSRPPPAREREHIPTKEEVRKMIELAPRMTKALVMVLAESGARIGSVLQLRRRHIDSQGPPFRIDFTAETMKGRIPCIGFICDDAMGFLRRWLVSVPDDPEVKIFDITESAVERQIRNLGVGIGICQAKGLSEFSSHKFRKRVQTCFEKARIPANWADRLLGHVPSHSAQAGAYSRPAEEDLREAYIIAMPYLKIF